MCRQKGSVACNDTVSEASRNAHPSQVGFIDSLRTAETASADLDLRFATTTLKSSAANCMRKAANGTLAQNTTVSFRR